MLDKFKAMALEGMAYFHQPTIIKSRGKDYCKGAQRGIRECIAIVEQLYTQTTEDTEE